MGKITKYLNQLTVGSVFDDQDILDKYSTDRSALKIKPKFVVLPESTDDIRRLMRFFNQLAAKNIQVAVTTRGSGMSDTGADLTNGVVISMEKLNRLLEIDTRERLVRVQAGITLRELNTALSVSGLQIPIDGHDEETIGGLISNNTVDDCAGKYGGIYDYVRRIEVVLANGECLQTERLKKYALAKRAAEKSFEGELYCKMAKLLKENQELVERLDDNDMNNLSGYPMVTKLQKRESMDLMPLFFGAEGTLGIISEVILKAVPLRKQPERVVATFREVNKAIEYAEMVGALNPRRLDLYDLKIVMEARASGKNLDGVIRKLEDGFVVFASFDERPNMCMRKVAGMRDKFPRSAKFIFESEKNRSTLNEFENSLTNYLSYVKKGERVPILTNFYLPTENIPKFLEDLEILEKKLELKMELYGSLGTSIFNLRPVFDLEDEDFNKKATTFLRAGAFIIGRQGGQLAGGVSEGRLKAVVTNTVMLEPEKNFYTKIKELFDRNGILNPDTKLGASSKFTLTHFRSNNLPKIVL